MASNPVPIPVSEPTAIAAKYSKRIVIILALEADGSSVQAATFGTTPEAKRQAVWLRDAMLEATGVNVAGGQVFEDYVTPARIERAAAAIANARGNRRGLPTITNILEALPSNMVDEVKDDARAALEAAEGKGGPR